MKKELLEIRKALADGTMKPEDAKNKLEELRSLKKQNEKNEAMDNAPKSLEKRGNNNMNLANAVKNAQLNTRARVDLSGTGNQKTLSDLVKSTTLKTKVLDFVKITYGANASTVVPCYSRYGSRLAPISEGGAYSDTAGTLSHVDLVPYTFGGKFLLSKMAQNLSEVELENEIAGLMNDEIADAICYEIFQGTGASGHFAGLQDGTKGAGTKTATTGSTIAMDDLRALAISMADKNFKDPAIFMSPACYSAIVSSLGSNADDKVYAEMLIRDKMVENIPVVVTGYMSYGSTSGDILVVGGDLAANYGIACAQEVNIEKKPVAGNAYDSYDFESYLAGAPIVPADFLAITLQ